LFIVAFLQVGREVEIVKDYQELPERLNNDLLMNTLVVVLFNEK